MRQHVFDQNLKDKVQRGKQEGPKKSEVTKTLVYKERENIQKQ